MRVRMKTRYANGERAIEPDTEAELDDAEARDLVAKGFAVPVGADPSRGEASRAKTRPVKAAKTTEKPPPTKPTGEKSGGAGGADGTSGGDGGDPPAGGAG